MLQFGTQHINHRGHLEIGGCDTVELAERFGTPLYVLDEALIRENCRAYVTTFGDLLPDTVIAYATKALLSTAICKIAQAEGLWLDVASAGELRTALSADFPPERIILHGNYKLDEELDAAIDAGLGLIVVDCLEDPDRVQAIAEQHDATVPVLIRVRPGVKAHTHEYIQTGHGDNKFGLGLPEGEALACVRRCLELPRLELMGLHCHIGSQIFALECFERATEVMFDFLRELRETTGFTATYVNLGGGLGIKYTHEDAPPALSHFARVVCEGVVACAERAGLPQPRLMLEPGRSIVGEAGTTLYRIGVIKEIPSVRNYVAVDGGLSDNPRPALYEAEYEAIIANKADQTPCYHARISGRHCETDTLIPDITIQQPERGDILAVFSTGAYNHAMASNYNRFCRPAVVLVCDGQADVIVQRETLDDVIRLDRIPPRLA